MVLPGGSGFARSMQELMVTSNFSFLRSGSDPEELIASAAANGLSGLGLCDRNSFAGVVRAFSALKQLKEEEKTKAATHGFRYVVGVRLVFADGTPDIIAYPTDRDAYGRLCRLLTIGNTREVDGKRAVKGECTLHFPDLAEFAEENGTVLKADETRWKPRLRPSSIERWREDASTSWPQNAGSRATTGSAAIAWLHLPSGVRVPTRLAVNDVLYHIPERRLLQDVVTCIREHTTIFEAGRRLEQNAERHIKPPEEIARLFREHPGAIVETQKLVERIGFRLDQLSYSYPEETVGDGETAQETLERLAWKGAAKRYPGGVPNKVKAGLWSGTTNRLQALSRLLPHC